MRVYGIEKIHNTEKVHNVVFSVICLETQVAICVMTIWGWLGT